MSQDEILLINPPDSFWPEVEQMKAFTRIVSSPEKTGKIDFILAFVTRQEEVDRLSGILTMMLAEDGIPWYAYPKQSSGKYKCDFNRDTGWHILNNLGFEGVRMVAIDEDWSTLRFRKQELIKKTKVILQNH